jgi:hypothetical protein
MEPVETLENSITVNHRTESNMNRTTSGKKRRIVVLGLAGLLATLGAESALAQSTAFTYQGLLDDAGSPADGPHDFRFRLFDLATGGAQVGPQLCADNVQVVVGKFTTPLNFGAVFATTAGRFLEIEVRSDTGLNCGSADGFVILSPRQPITPAPRATAASVANALAAPDGSPASAVFVDSDGKVGIGTTTPQSILHVAGWQSVFDAPGGAIRVTKTLGLLSSDDLGIWNRGGNGGQPFAIADWNTGTRGIFINTSSGNVGINATVPQARLDVRGSIKLGNAGEFFAPAAEENLRLVRGDIAGNGSILRGGGFTCTRISAGHYRIDFTSPFSAPPTVTATAAYTGLLVPARIASYESVIASRVYINTRHQDDSNFTDTDFSFCVIGPR